jgi:hypothetical protein
MTNVNTNKYLPLVIAFFGLLISPFIMRSLGLTPGTATDVVIYAMAALGLVTERFLESALTLQRYPKNTGLKGRSCCRFYSLSFFARCSRHS